MVYALVLGTSAERHVGSTPTSDTNTDEQDFGGSIPTEPAREGYEPAFSGRLILFPARLFDTTNSSLLHSS